MPVEQEAKDKDKLLVGIGLTNMKDRLNRVYAGQYQMNIESALNQYTSVHIEIPMVEKGDGNETSAC